MNGMMWFIVGASVSLALFTLMLDRQERKMASDPRYTTCPGCAVRQGRELLMTLHMNEDAATTTDAIDAMYRARMRHDD